MKKILTFLMLLALCSLNAAAQTTTFWLVRHAEKDTSDLKNTDPDLSATGMQRAKDLAQFLIKNKPAVIFTTVYRRTVQTASIVAADHETETRQYDPGDLKAMVAEIEKYTGKQILIVGHSNTVLETIEALGGTKPLHALTDGDYDYIFKVTKSGKGKIKTETFHYGARHRDSNGGAMNMKMN